MATIDGLTSMDVLESRMIASGASWDENVTMDEACLFLLL
jgi:hypothetical protein